MAMAFLYWLIASELRASAESAPSSCPQGELPHLARAGFEDWWGRDHVPIGDGQVHTYCFTVNMDTHQLALAVGDRTGKAQCFWHVAEYIPPTESGWSARVEAGRDTSYTFSLRSELLPKGVWRIRITNDVTPNCADQYQVVAH